MSWALQGKKSRRGEAIRQNTGGGVEWGGERKDGQAHLPNQGTRGSECLRIKRNKADSGGQAAFNKPHWLQ